MLFAAKPLHIGAAQAFSRRQVGLAVSPGHHTVQLCYGGRAYLQRMHVRAGTTAVVQARLMKSLAALPVRRVAARIVKIFERTVSPKVTPLSSSLFRLSSAP